MKTAHSPHSLIDRAFAWLDTLGAGDRFLFAIAALVFVGSAVWLLLGLNASTLITVPGRGGSLTEGVVGTPRFANPVLAVSSADQDLVALLYAGLMKRGADGELVPDLAESVTVSEDGLVYAVTLRENATFHDGEPLTAEDVAFTVAQVQDPALKSPLLASWDGVSVEVHGERELNFVLPEPYAPFRENLTLGILPKHIWEHAGADEFPFSQFNTEPIGAGPYRIEQIHRSRSGVPNAYELTPHAEYHGTQPHIATLLLRFYPSEEALVSALIRGEVASTGGLSGEALTRLNEAGVRLHEERVPLPRSFALFFNQNETALLRDASVREALSLAIDREAIVREVLAGSGVPINSPLPPETVEAAPETEGARVDEARDVLRAGGWKVDEESDLWQKTEDGVTTSLTFSISTANTPLFGETAARLASTWEELGVPVTVKQFEQPDLAGTVIRPRNFETLLFGTVVGRELDFFSFWHSSQRNDPGLNVALYANLTVDSVLEEARVTTDPERRAELFAQFAAELEADMPALFLFAPTYSHVSTAPLDGVSLTGIGTGADRFSTVEEWSVERDAVWRIFTDTGTE